MKLLQSVRRARLCNRQRKRALDFCCNWDWSQRSYMQPNVGRTLIEKFEHYAWVPYAILFLTPDDAGGPCDNKRDRDRRELKQRARQNVIFELGYFIGKLRRMKV